MSLTDALARLIGKLQRRKTAYQLTFGSPAGKAVLNDLAVFCRAEQSEWGADARHHARYAGRREVWLRIMQHMNLSPAELAVVYRAAVLDQTGDNDA